LIEKTAVCDVPFLTSI